MGRASGSRLKSTAARQQGQQGQQWEMTDRVSPRGSVGGRYGEEGGGKLDMMLSLLSGACSRRNLVLEGGEWLNRGRHLIATWPPGQQPRAL